MTDRHDPRFVASDHPDAVYRAWVRGEISVGAWTGDASTLDAFRAAVRDQYRAGTGEELADEEIEVRRSAC